MLIHSKKQYSPITVWVRTTPCSRQRLESEQRRQTPKTDRDKMTSEVGEKPGEIINQTKKRNVEEKRRE